MESATETKTLAATSKRARKPEPATNPFAALSDDLLLVILAHLESTSPASLKPLSLASLAFHSLVSLHRRSLAPLRSSLLPAAVARFPNLSSLNLTLCPSVPDHILTSLLSVSSTLRTLDLSQSRGYTCEGLERVIRGCRRLVEVDLSNRREFGDREARVVGMGKGLEKVGMGKWRELTDVGLGFVVEGCERLRVLGLKGCVNVTDVGVEMVGAGCKELRGLDLSYSFVSNLLPFFSAVLVVVVDQL